MREIDWDALEAIETEHLHWRLNSAKDLSPVYVPGEGNNPIAFIIGEAPGAQEEIHRRPFVGTAGVAMRDLMASAGLHASVELAKPNCWLTNVLKFRPPKNRTPTPVEIKAVRLWLLAEWEAVGKPSLIIPTGGTALTAVLGKPTSILRAAGKCHGYTSREGQDLFIWPMVHPSFGVRMPAVRSLLEQDWERLGEWLQAKREWL